MLSMKRVSKGGIFEDSEKVAELAVLGGEQKGLPKLPCVPRINA